MDKSHEESEIYNLNESVTNADEFDESSRSKCGSPVFKCVNSHKSNRVNRLDNSDYDIPCYQINQSGKSRSSYRTENEENDSILPFSPLLSPILAPVAQFQPPLIHSLGTVAKKANMGKNPKSAEKDSKGSQNVFESLGMTDKDISWVSSMASPVPAVPKTEFNTIEKATFLPEEKFQNIQPRALFSPTLDEDFGCQPLTFSSESEDDEAYKTNMRLSDVCNTLKQLVVKSLEANQNAPNDSDKTPSSPVIKTKKESIKKLKKTSPTKEAENYDFIVGDQSFTSNKSIKGSSASSQSIGFTEDDSFQSISFSGLDELCKTLVNSTDQSDCDKTLTNTPFRAKCKPFYQTTVESEVYKVSSMTNMHSYALALEKGDVSKNESSKIEKSVAEKGIVRFDVLDKDVEKVQAVKRLHSELSEKKECGDKKARKENSNWEGFKEYLSESQLDVSDSEIFKTVENLEKTVLSPKVVEIEESSVLPNTQELSELERDFKEEFSNNEENQKKCPPFIAFQTASGTKVSVSEEALAKARETFKKLEENPEETIKPPPSFSTCRGTKIQVSNEALEKAKALMLDCNAAPTQKKKIKVSPEALEKAKALMCDDKVASFVPSKTMKVSPEALEKAKALMEDGGQVGFSTGSGRRIVVSEKALEKAKALMLECDESSTENKEIKKPVCEPPTFPGFVTGLGKQVRVSEEALQKAKALMLDVDKSEPEVTPPNTQKPNTSLESEDWSEIIPSWLHSYNTSPSIASDRLSPVLAHENGNSSAPDREYIIKSPVLGSSDRFFNKTKRKKLNFEENKTPGFPVPYKDGARKASAKRTCSNLSIDFSVPFKKLKHDAVEERDSKKERETARAAQEKLVKEKDRVKPEEGSLLRKKRLEKQMSWLEAVRGCRPDIYSKSHLKNLGVREEVLSVDIENAACFRFDGEQYFGPVASTNTTGIPQGDNCLLILDNDNKAGVEDFKRAFLASPGVQPNLIPEGWIQNHYKWIVWKLAHYEKSFPQYFGGRCLTPNNVLLQLKYRYDREIDKSERSALKKILERDDSSVKRMVLCVCGIKKVQNVETGEYEINLTDGWYCCPARSDPAMTRLIEEGRLRVGTKLIIQGAVLVNCEQGTSPLEISGSVYLKISTNSTRRARWDVKLGYQKNPENFTISLGSVLPQGGPISRLDIIIVRIYPMLYMERTPDGRRVTRNLRAEEKADAEYRKLQERRMEAIRKEVQQEMQNTAKGMSNKMLNNMEQEDLCRMMESSSDPSALQESLSAHQRQILQNIHLQQTDRIARDMFEKIEQKMKKEKLNKRDVSEFLRMRIVDLKKPDYNNPAVLSVWNPNEEVQRLFLEGRAVSLTNVSVGNSRICKQIQLNTTRQTQYKNIPRNIKYPARKVTLLKEVSSKLCPVFEEIDLVGFVAKLQDVSYGSRLSQVVYLADLEFNFVGIVFWGNCRDYGWENVLKPRSTVACSNLQWKKNSCLQDVPSLHVNENSVFTENPKHTYLKEELEKFKKNLPEDLNAFALKCEEDLTAALEESRWKTNSSRNDSSVPEIQPLKPRFANGFESKPKASSTPLKPFDGGLDCGEAEPSPIQKKIEKLQSYGEPPPLMPLIVSKNVRKSRRKMLK